MLFPNEDAYDGLIQQAASDNSLDPALIKGIIAQESNFVARAYRAEPQINDASYGLMQLLYQTAKGMGYTGTAQGLFDPATNIQYGAAFLSDLIRQSDNAGYGVESAISAYNAGFSSDRPGDGKRATNRVDGYVTDGSQFAPFINQHYVDAVLSYMQHYAQVAAAPKPTSGPTSGGMSSTTIVLVLAGATLAALALSKR
jgi:soluble lytic murein transglycosylase-like protein